MPRTAVRLFREADGTTPFLDWIGDLERREPRAYVKCLERLGLLSQLGSELRRPLADTLRDGIRELRVRVGSVHYRILYFFCGSNVVCLSHGLTKEGKVPDAQIDVAVGRKRLVERDIDRYTADLEEACG